MTAGLTIGFGNLADCGIEATGDANLRSERLDCGILQQQEILWLYAVEDAVLMVEVEPEQEPHSTSNIGQVVLKRLITAEQAIDVLNRAELVFNSTNQNK